MKIWSIVKGGWSAISGLVWLAVRYFKRKDADEPQTRIDEARTAAATGDDKKINAALDAARDRAADYKLRHPDGR